MPTDARTRAPCRTSLSCSVGVLGAAMLTRYLESLLFELTTLDLSTFASVAAAFSLIAMIAAYVPARRATTVDPLEALRYE